MQIFTHRHLIQFWIGVLTSLMAMASQAEVLLWSIDARQGLARVAEQSEWSEFIKTRGQAESIRFLTPSEEGLAAYYAELLAESPDMQRLTEGASFAGAEGSLWVRLDPVGALWVLARKGGEVESLSTAANAEGLSSGVAWVKQRISVSEGMGAETRPSAVLAPNPNFIYRDAGRLVRISGIVDESDYLRLTASIKQLSSVDYTYVAELSSATNLVLVVGTQLDAYSLDSLLSQQSWLSSSGSGSFRWNARGATVQTGVEAQQNRAAE